MIRGMLLGIVLTLLFGAAAWLVVTYGGFYNVAASDPRTDAVRWTLETTLRRSVSRQAVDVRMPVSVPQEVLEEGARHYAGACAQCHGAPGEEAEPWAEGMRPEPPALTEAATEWSPEEVAWIVENGIKMSGMPAFGGRLSLEEIVAVAAFVRELPGLSARDYATMATGARRCPTSASSNADLLFRLEQGLEVSYRGFGTCGA
jgi:mono/diheme cytochrome c family protein